MLLVQRRFSCPRLSYRLLAGGLAATLSFLVGPSAQAAKTTGEANETSGSKALRACLTGDYQSGLAILSDLFVKTKEPTWIYNQGRCLEQNGKYEEAISRFEEYLRLTKGKKSEDREDAQEHLAECQSKLAKTTAIATAPVAAPVAAPTETPLVAPLAPPEPVAPVIENKPAPVPEPSGKGLRIAGITVGAAGVALLGGGLTFNLVANNTAKDLNKSGGYDRDKASTRSTYQTLSWVGYGVGGACLLGGALLYYFGIRGSDSSTVALVPAFLPGQAGVSLHGAF